MILVTGATGTVGSNVIRELQTRGAEFRAFVRDPVKAKALLGDVELVIGDFADPDSVSKALDGIDRLFLLSPDDPRQVEWESQAIDAASAAGVTRIVKLSMLGAQVGAPLSFLDSHGRVEQHLERSGVAAVLIRPGFFMSNLLAAADQIRTRRILFAPAAGAKISMIDPRDVGAVAAVALTEDSAQGPYAVTGPEAVDYAGVAEAISAATGRLVTFINVPDEVAHRGLLAAGVPEWFADSFVALFGLLRSGLRAETTDAVRVLTGRDPKTIADFAHDHSAAFS